MTQNLTKESREEIIACDKRFARDLNIILGISGGALAVLFINISILSHRGINDLSRWLLLGVFFLLLPTVLAMESGLGGIRRAIFGDLVGMGFTVILTTIKIGVNTATTTSILGLKALFVAIIIAAIIAIILKTGASIFKFVLERMEPTLNKAGEHLNKISKTNDGP